MKERRRVGLGGERNRTPCSLYKLSARVVGRSAVNTTHQSCLCTAQPPQPSWLRVSCKKHFLCTWSWLGCNWELVTTSWLCFFLFFPFFLFFAVIGRRLFLFFPLIPGIYLHTVLLLCKILSHLFLFACWGGLQIAYFPPKGKWRIWVTVSVQKNWNQNWKDYFFSSLFMSKYVHCLTIGRPGNPNYCSCVQPVFQAWSPQNSFVDWMRERKSGWKATKALLIKICPPLVENHGQTLSHH